MPDVILSEIKTSSEEDEEDNSEQVDFKQYVFIFEKGIYL